MLVVAVLVIFHDLLRFYRIVKLLLFHLVFLREEQLIHLLLKYLLPLLELGNFQTSVEEPTCARHGEAHIVLDLLQLEG